jgi:hypothetical protein
MSMGLDAPTRTSYLKPVAFALGVFRFGLSKLAPAAAAPIKIKALSGREPSSINVRYRVVKMNDDDETNEDRIYVDDSLPATLRYYGRMVRCATLHEAIIAWRKLPEDVRTDATIKVDEEGGSVYQASEITRLYRGPQPVAGE